MFRLGPMLLRGWGIWYLVRFQATCRAPRWDPAYMIVWEIISVAKVFTGWRAWCSRALTGWSQFSQVSGSANWPYLKHYNWRPNTFPLQCWLLLFFFFKKPSSKNYTDGIYLTHKHIGGLVQERRNFSALAIELRLSCSNPSTCKWISDV